MQTFLPYPDFLRTAECLDLRRLGKQRVEALQIHNIVSGKRTAGGWVHHPTVSMWRGYTDALAVYQNTMIIEWIRRGYKNNMPFLSHNLSYQHPYWLGDPRLHNSHRSNLLRKNYEYYSQFGWTDNIDMPYFYPVQLC
jgi:hypothetical protein